MLKRVCDKCNVDGATFVGLFDSGRVGLDLCTECTKPFSEAMEKFMAVIEEVGKKKEWVKQQVTGDMKLHTEDGKEK